MMIFRLSRVLACPAPHATFGSWARKLAREAEAVTDSSSSSAPLLWEEIDKASLQAFALKETDTLFSIVQCLWKKGCVPADLGMWPKMAERLLTYADVECKSVLCYPGVPDSELKTSFERAGSQPATTVSDPSLVSHGGTTFHVRASRENLLLTGGVVPLSSRLAVADGLMMSHFVNAFVDLLESGPSQYRIISPDVLFDTLTRMNSALIAVLQRNASTTLIDNVSNALCRYFVLLVHCDVYLMKDRSTDVLASRFVEALLHDVPTNGLGAQIAVCALSHTIGAVAATADTPSAAASSSHHDGAAGTPEDYISASQHLVEASRSGRGMSLALIRTVLEGFYHAYADRGNGNECMAPRLERIYDFLDVALQYNANERNPLQLEADGSEEQRLRDAALTALLRALRIEADAPDAFLRTSMSVVDKCSPSMAVEGELIMGKVALFKHFDLDDEAKESIYEDILTSLRNFVDLRPRDNTTLLAGTGGEEDDSESQPASSSSTPYTMQMMDRPLQGLMQEVHKEVIALFCASSNMRRINEAYNIVVTHKYHGLLVTKEIIKPLVETLSRQGDCRVFNIVDVCVLYSNQEIDMPIIACLFSACAAAGDHFRARTLLDALTDIVPGFLLKASEDILESLRALQVLPAEPFHLFVPEEEKMVQSAIGRQAEPLRKLQHFTQSK